MRCWVGAEVAKSAYIPELIAAFEALDPESAFQDLRSLFKTWATGKRGEIAAIRKIETILKAIWEARGVRKLNFLFMILRNNFIYKLVLLSSPLSLISFRPRFED